ncbi:MAG: hypothetical protein NUW37_02255 [Planctomycetes bacterium]|nr:hypothetical protein [Planctomycetota bacterium]
MRKQPELKHNVTWERWDPVYETAAARLRQLWHNETYASIEKKLDVPRGWAYDLVRGRKKLAIDLAIRVCKVWGCKLHWLIGHTYETPGIPIVGIATAGTTYNPDSLLLEDLRGMEPILFEGCEAYLVSGDSMAPLAHHGQKILVGPPGRVRDNAPAFVELTDGRKMVKRVTRTDDDNAFILTSINVNDNSHPPIVVRRDDVVVLREVLGIDMRTIPSIRPAISRRRRSEEEEEEAVRPVRQNHKVVYLIARQEMLRDLAEVLREIPGVQEVRTFLTPLSAGGKIMPAFTEGVPVFIDSYLPDGLTGWVLDQVPQDGTGSPLIMMTDVEPIVKIYRETSKVRFQTLRLPFSPQDAEALLARL